MWLASHGLLTANASRCAASMLFIDSTLPIGAGLSSSAALELAAAWTLTAEVPPLEPTALARAAPCSERIRRRPGRFDRQVRVDPWTSRPRLAARLPCHRAFGGPNTRGVDAGGDRHTNAPQAWRFGVQRAEGPMRTGRGDHCAALPGSHCVARRLTRDAGNSEGILDEQTMRRCRHVIEENQRVLDVGRALAQGDLDQVARHFAGFSCVPTRAIRGLIRGARRTRGDRRCGARGSRFANDRCWLRRLRVNLVRHSGTAELRRAVERGLPVNRTRRRLLRRRAHGWGGPGRDMSSGSPPSSCGRRR